MLPLAVVIAGPSGSGKSTYFPVREFGIGSFNVDDRCAQLNHGSYQAIPYQVRAQAQTECERFIAESIAGHCSFAVETTLRTLVAVEQAERARAGPGGPGRQAFTLAWSSSRRTTWRRTSGA
jgi:predicted ABC-type ATPase